MGHENQGMDSCVWPGAGDGARSRSWNFMTAPLLLYPIVSAPCGSGSSTLPVPMHIYSYFSNAALPVLSQFCLDMNWSTEEWSALCRKSGEMSAYSVFNPGCKAIDGTLTADQFENEIRHRSLKNWRIRWYKQICDIFQGFRIFFLYVYTKP